MNFADEVSLSYAAGIFNLPQHFTTLGPTALRPLRKSRATDFIALKNQIVLGRIWTCEPLVQWQARCQ
jgi:hypothetical protein